METDKILGTNYTIGQLQLIHKYIKEAYKTEDESSDGKVDINAYIDDVSKILDFVGKLKVAANMN